MPPTTAPSRNLEFEAAVELLRARALMGQAERYVDDERQTIDFERLLPASLAWSTSQQWLVAAALGLWGREDLLEPERLATVQGIATRLDSNSLLALQRALAIRKGWM